jgi:cyclophilin family peptidyl-prolyl cis-trans isomerase
MIQTGDAENGDGTGGSPLGPFPDAFNPLLSFDAPGVLAFANSGPDTSDSQFFITAAPTTWLNDGYFIFGQMVRLASIRRRERAPTIRSSTCRWSPTPRVRSAGRRRRPIWPAWNFSQETAPRAIWNGPGPDRRQLHGEAQLTITVTDQEGNEVSAGRQRDRSPRRHAHHRTPGEETSFYLDLSGTSAPGLSSTYDQGVYSLDTSNWLVTLQSPEGYKGVFALTLSDAITPVSKTIVFSQAASDPAAIGLLPDSMASFTCTVRMEIF